MQPDAIENLRAMRGGPRDGVLLRMSLANALLANSDMPAAITELHEALRFDPGYSAAWKLLGKTLAGTGSTAAAIDAYQAGIAAANERGDKQAEKEMTVFLRRLTRAG
ncbi:MAG: tetratricopeptide repeat protein [Proteobacteria bacterium]|uniref:tetratricopeptide repeat protein n=1 Tax=Rudaea sp. TaxID=2136325 RepID=UPI003783ACED|nr:tetratricopeptide repeat protein [Pseudomonadota bacterium]